MDKVDILKKMIARMPGDADTWYLLGMELSEAGHLDEALKAYTKALKYSDSDQKVKIYAELDRITSQISGSDQPNVPLNNDANGSDEKNILFEATSDGAPGSLLSEDSEDMEDASERYYKDDQADTAENDRPVKLKLLRGGISNTGSHPAMEINKPVTSFADIGGLEELKETIRMRIIKPFNNPGLFSMFKKKTGGGLLLYGPPGCGKTFMAKATAGECSAKFIPVHITDILDPYIGMSEQNVKAIFSNARSNRPCILFFDEIDTVGFNRAKLSSEHMRSVIDQLLTEIEGIDTSTEKMLIIGATNMPWDVDPAFKRPGRFDKAIFVPPPDLKAREVIFRLKLEGRPYENVDFSALAKNTELFSGADIENVVETAAEYVITDIMKTGLERRINMGDLGNAVKNTKPSTIEWLRTIKNYVKYANQSGIYDDVEKYINGVKKYF